MNPELMKFKLQELQKLIAFYEDTHQYFYKGNSCISVTQLIKKYKEPFNQKEKAIQSSKNHNSKWYNKEPANIIEQWQEMNKLACDKGTIIHRYAELYELGLDNLESYPKCYDEWYQQVRKFIKDNLSYKQTMTECIVFHPLIMLAGMIDLIVFNKDGTLSLYDYKTNPSIDKDNKYNKYLYAPLNIPDTKFHGYSLQLSIYKKILEHHKFKIRDMFLVHIKHDNYEIIPCQCYDREVNELFKSMLIELKKPCIN